ncbi:MAG: hypothetical protein EZS28_051318, partial [Streblomastix strix]
MILSPLIYGNGRKDSMIHTNIKPDQGTGVHNDRILPDLQGQPQRNSFSYNSQTLSVQGNTENKQGLQGDTSNGIGGGNYRNNNQRTSEIGCQNDNLANGLVNQVRPEVSFPPSDSLRTTQTLSGIRSGGSVLQVQGNALWDPSLVNIFHGGNESNHGGGERDMGSANNQLLGRYSPIIPGLNDLEIANNPFDGNIRTVLFNNLGQEVVTGTEAGVGILKMDLKLGNNVIIYAGRSKIDELGFNQVIIKDNFG